MRRDRVSHETLASVSCFEGTCTSSRFRRARVRFICFPARFPVSLMPGVLQEVGLCDRNRNISRRCFDVFYKVDPEFVPLFSSLTHCCYGIPPYRNSTIPLFLRPLVILLFFPPSVSGLCSLENERVPGAERRGCSGRKMSTNSKVDPIRTHVKVANFDSPCRCHRIRLPFSLYPLFPRSSSHEEMDSLHGILEGNVQGEWCNVISSMKSNSKLNQKRELLLILLNIT